MTDFVAQGLCKGTSHEKAGQAREGFFEIWHGLVVLSVRVCIACVQQVCVRASGARESTRARALA